MSSFWAKNVNSRKNICTSGDNQLKNMDLIRQWSASWFVWRIAWHDRLVGWGGRRAFPVLPRNACLMAPIMSRMQSIRGKWRCRHLAIWAECWKWLCHVGWVLSTLSGSLWQDILGRRCPAKENASRRNGESSCPVPMWGCHQTKTAVAKPLSRTRCGEGQGYWFQMVEVQNYQLTGHGLISVVLGR